MVMPGATRLPRGKRPPPPVFADIGGDVNGGEGPRTADGVSPFACFPLSVLAARTKHSDNVCIIDRADIIRPNGV